MKPISRCCCKTRAIGQRASAPSWRSGSPISMAPSITGEEPRVLFEIHDGVAWLTLNRPQAHNALDLMMRDELWRLLDVVEMDDEIGVVVFQGAGRRAFSSGADISEFGTAPSLDAARRSRLERDLWGRLLKFEKVLIASIHGYALGAG